MKIDIRGARQGLGGRAGRRPGGGPASPLSYQSSWSSMVTYLVLHPHLLIKKPRDKKPGSERDAAIFFLSLRNEGLDLPEQICHEMPLIYEFRRHSTIFRTEISSRIHFWGLEGPKMVKIGQKLLKKYFSIFGVNFQNWIFWPPTKVQ